MTKCNPNLKKINVVMGIEQKFGLFDHLVYRETKQATILKGNVEG